MFGFDLTCSRILVVFFSLPLSLVPLFDELVVHSINLLLPLIQLLLFALVPFFVILELGLQHLVGLLVLR